MMARRHWQDTNPDSSDIEAALAMLGADELREVVLDMLLELDERARGRVVDSVIERAARGASDWTPESPSDAVVSEIITFAEAARRIGYADPSEVDDYLRQGANAFLGKGYSVACEIFRALLPSIGDGEIDLGQHEMVDEVLGTDVSACAAQYVVSMYMTVSPDERAEVVRAAIDDVRGVGHFWEPLREMESVAVEPLPELGEFLPRWRTLIEANAKSMRRSDWGTDEDRWLREVVQRLEGAEGLAKVARSTKRADDLRAWCRMLVASRDWKDALSAYEEAAEIVADKAYSRGEFLDGAVLAAQKLGCDDLPVRLERAWRQAPSMQRLRRWLGSSDSKRVLQSRVAQALEVCPENVCRQRAFLHVLLGDHESAAKLLAAAPGLGWSDSEHPGHLLFPLFYQLLGDGPSGSLADTGRWSSRGMGIDELEGMSADRDEPRLATPGADEILGMAGVDDVPSYGVRKAVLQGMRKAAEKRLCGVTENKRRRHYGHAAALVAVCAALDSTSDTRQWVAGIRAEYRRYPALQRELNSHLGRV